MYSCTLCALEPPAPDTANLLPPILLCSRAWPTCMNLKGHFPGALRKVEKRARNSLVMNSHRRQPDRSCRATAFWDLDLRTRRAQHIRTFVRIARSLVKLSQIRFSNCAVTPCIILKADRILSAGIDTVQP